ncbi:MAG: class I SAM-dependent methyltransferase [Chloroflexi bacterium]|nr:class I SAM-dependent methyltransferase [Chloroflexota bacterium]
MNNEQNPKNQNPNFQQPNHLTTQPPNNLVERYYDFSTSNEWSRLDRHRTEFALTLRALKDFLPHAPANILDCGGGPGRYAIELTKQGYAVTLFDLSAINLSFARTQAYSAGVAVSAYEHGTATDLSRFADESFEIVLLLGPLYHLFALEERLKCLQEAHRVLKKGGVLFASFVTQYAALRYFAKEVPEWILQYPKEIEAFWKTGVFPPVRNDGTEFLAYFCPPAEVKPLIESANFKVQTVLACEGVVSMIDEKLNALEGELWEAWVDLNYRLAPDPSLHGACEHLLCVAHK